MAASIDIATIWAFIIAFAVFVYIVMDGFDLGLGLLFPLFSHKAERDTLMNSVAPVCRSKSSIRRRTALMESPSRSAADLKLPQRVTSRKILAASQSVRPPSAALWCSS